MEDYWNWIKKREGSRKKIRGRSKRRKCKKEEIMRKKDELKDTKKKEKK